MRRRCGIFSALWSESCRCRKASVAESGRGLPSRQFFIYLFLIKFLDSYQQLPKFPGAGNRQEGQLRKIELKLYEVVIGTVFRPLF